MEHVITDVAKKLGACSLRMLLLTLELAHELRLVHRAPAGRAPALGITPRQRGAARATTTAECALRAKAAAQRKGRRDPR